ncbi:type II secretion system F family protein [Geodermatophilus sp. SYSU D00705]
MSALVAALLAAALLVGSPRRPGVAARVRALSTDRAGPSRRGGAGARRSWLLAGGAGTAAGLLVGGLPGVAVAVAVAVLAEHLLRRAAGQSERAGPALAGDLPVACDLLAVCLAAGLPLAGALAAVASTLPAPLGPALHEVAALHRLGASPQRAWADAPAELAVLGRVLVRAGESGSAVVPALRTLASDTRAEARSRADTAVRQAGVWVLAPLGACFLPAFVCLGVAPLVLGIAADVFG